MAIRDFYSDVDLKANQLFNSRLHNITTADRIILGTSLTLQDKGYQVYDTDLSNPYYWDGTTWLLAYIITPAALTKTDDTNVTITLGGSPNTALLQGVSLTLGWTGTLDDSRITSASTWNSKEPGITAGTTSQYWRGDKSWQTLDKSAVGLGNVENTALSTWAGSTNITTLGTITSGTWHGSSIGDSYISSASTWNGKQNALSGTGIVKSTSGTISYLTDNTANWDNAYSNRISTLTTIGSSGPATLNSNVLNIPSYTISGLGGVPSFRSITINGTNYDLSADRTWNVGTVTSVAALTIGTIGTDISSTVANGSTTPVITLNIPTASSTVRGALSDTDWTTFNNKQNALSGSGIVKSTSGSISYISGTSSEFIKGDGSLDSNTYLTAAVTSVAAGTGMNFSTITGTGNVDINTEVVPYYPTGFTPGLAKWNGSDWTWDNNTYLTTAVTSVDLSMPPAFTVSNNPVTTTGTLTVAAAGVPTQYIRGDGVLADFPTNTGGGTVANYYLNGSISQGNIDGNDYFQMSKTPVIGGGTNFDISTNGYIGYFITDPLDPSLLSIPPGSWNFKIYMSASSAGGSPSFYLELYKYDGSTFTLIADGSSNQEMITGGTSVDLYYTSVAVPLTSLTVLDRIAVRMYVNNSGKTITLHTENDTLAQVGTTFSIGLTALNGVTSQVQYFQTGTTGTDFNIDSIGTPSTHVLNIPVASETNTGKLSNNDFKTFNNKASKGFAVAMAAAL